MRIDILTLFPEMCYSYLNESVVGRARNAGALEIECTDIRDYTVDKHNRGGRRTLRRRNGHDYAGTARF